MGSRERESPLYVYLVKLKTTFADDSDLYLFILGAHHAVDSSELAFRLAAIGAVRQGSNP